MRQKTTCMREMPREPAESWSARKNLLSLTGRSNNEKTYMKRRLGLAHQGASKLGMPPCVKLVMTLSVLC